MTVGTGIAASIRPVFSGALNSVAAADLLAYFHGRREVTYFPVVDAQEVRRDRIDAIVSNQFEFNGESYILGGDDFWLHNPSADLEWLIQLHKFYYAPGLGIAHLESGHPRYASKWMDLTESWIRATPLDFLPSDVAGRRIRNWVHAHYYFVTLAATPAISPDFYEQFLVSLWEQTNHLRDNLSPARNHRTLELCALFWVAVVFPEFRGADEWLDYSRTELTRNMQTDLLKDGVQCELSFDYHHIVLRNYLGVRS